MNLRYRFAPDKGPVKEIALNLDPDTLTSPVPDGPPPDWAKLEHKQCEECPLKASESPYCPVAVRLAPLLQQFKDDISFNEAEISVETQGRTYSKRAPMQNGVSGLFGLVMATSGCPILDKLRPMVFLHLPFPSSKETLYRSMSMYLLGQFFIAQKGGVADWTLTGLSAIYERVGRVNSSLVERIRPQVNEDATLNAVVNLDCFASLTVSALSKTPKEWLERLFKPYWESR